MGGADSKRREKEEKYLNEFNMDYQELGSSTTLRARLNRQKEMQGQAHSEFTAKDSVTPASVFPQMPAVGLCHLHGAAVPLVL